MSPTEIIPPPMSTHFFAPPEKNHHQRYPRTIRRALHLPTGFKYRNQLEYSIPCTPSCLIVSLELGWEIDPSPFFVVSGRKCWRFWGRSGPFEILLEKVINLTARNMISNHVPTVFNGDSTSGCPTPIPPKNGDRAKHRCTQCSRLLDY